MKEKKLIDSSTDIEEVKETAASTDTGSKAYQEGVLLLDLNVFKTEPC